MHASKIAKLAAAGLLQPVLGAAAKHAVGADDVVHALQGRAVPSAARTAAAGLTAEHRSALKALEWPFTCPGCGALAAELVTCPGCRAQGCDACAVPGKCPACRKAEGERAAQLDRKNTELSRQVAAREAGRVAAEAESARIFAVDAARAAEVERSRAAIREAQAKAREAEKNT